MKASCSYKGRSIRAEASGRCRPASLNHDESPEAAGVRETREETSLNVRIDKLLAVYPNRDQGLADIVIAYSAQVVSGKAKAGDDAADVGWFERDSLPPLVVYPSTALISLWRRGELEL